MGRKSLLYIIWALKLSQTQIESLLVNLDNNHMYKCQVICLSLFEQQQSCRQVVEEGKETDAMGRSKFLHLSRLFMSRASLFFHLR